MIHPIEKDLDFKSINMSDMEPYDLGVVIDGIGPYNGEVVMRSASVDNFQVFSLTIPKADRYWNKGSSLKVRLFEPGEKVLLEVK